MTFLSITSSASGREWRDRLDEQGRGLSERIRIYGGIPDLLARILAGRGVQAEAVEDYLAPSIKALMPEPNSLQDMEKAAARLSQAVINKEKVAIFGDYDVDGATSSAILALFLKEAGLTPIIHIPDRLTEGYGPNSEAIETLKAQGATLLITVDCGTTSHKVLQGVGMDVIVIDHHQADEILPEVVALVNPKRMDDLSGLDYLAACGVVFMVCVAVNRALREAGLPSQDLMRLTDCVALGTVADMVPLTGLNRAFVRRGLEKMRGRKSVGLTALIDVSRLKEKPAAGHLGFLLGPRINAGGRIGDAALGARLLTLDDPLEAADIAAELDKLNQERQVIEKAALVEAEAEALAMIGVNEDLGAVIVTVSDTWHPGVVGLVASRLKERFQRPAFAITFERGRLGTGSGRSITGVDLGKTVREAVALGLLTKGGGHAMAAGLTIEKANLGAFRAFMDQQCVAAIKTARTEKSLFIDGAMTARAATPAFVASFEEAGPFGTGNPEPVFAFPYHALIFADVVGENHLRCRFKSNDGAELNAIAFRVVGSPLGDFLMKHRGQAVHVVGTLSTDSWQGRERVQLRIIDAAGG